MLPSVWKWLEASTRYSDALHGLLVSLQADETRLHLQTIHVNTHHLAFITDARRFKMPAPIADPATLRKIHQNYAISYLTDAALPLAHGP